MTKARSLSDFIESDGSVTLVDNQKIKVGTGNDLEIYHDGLNSYVQDSGTGSLRLAGADVGLLNAGATDFYINCSGTTVTLYHNGSPKLATTSSGVNVTGHITASGTLQIFHDGNNSFINNTTGAAGALSIKSHDINIMDSQSHNMAVFTQDGAVTLYYDNSAKLATNSGGVSVTGTAVLGGASFVDNANAYFGTDLDLRIYHDGSHSFVKESGTGNLYILGDSLLLQRADQSQTYIQALTGGAVDLRHAGNVKLATFSGGIDVSGVMYIGGGTAQAVGIGASMGDVNASEHGPGYLNLARDDTADAKQILFEKNDVEHSSIITKASSLDIVSAQPIKINSSGNVQISSGGVGSADGALSVIGTSATGDMITRFEYSGNDNDVKGIRVNAPNTSGTQTYADISVDPEAYEVGISVAQSGGGLAIGNSDHSNAELVVTNQRIVNGATKTYTYLNTDVVEANKSGGRISACVQDEFHIGGEKYFNSRYHDSPSVTRTYYDGGSSGYAGYGYPGNSTYIPNIYIPYSPTQVYSLSATIYQHTGNANHYMGVIGYDENFNAVYVDGIGTYQYILASNSYLAQGNFLKTQNAISNWQGSGQTDGNKMDEGTVYLRPMLLLNYAASTTKLAIVCGFTIQASGVSNTLLHTLSAGTDY